MTAMSAAIPRQRVVGAGLIAAALLLLAGCAGPGGFFSDDKPAFRDPALTVQAAADVLVAGRMTRADVAAALGPATAISFDSGYEVWVYRAPAKSGLSRQELVILFEPSGTLKKYRVRPPYRLPGR